MWATWLGAMLLAMAGDGHNAQADRPCEIDVADGRWILHAPGALPMASGDLAISTEVPDEPTGTMHYATRVTIGRGAMRPLVFDDEDSHLLPIFLRTHVKLTDTSYLVQ